ncbi:MAG: Rv3235 family protein [Actinomycetota bacterium]|nr:Rv3235 family protein [Actinomycetota bacterium]
MTDRIAPLRSLANQRNRGWRPIYPRGRAETQQQYSQGSLALVYPLSSGLAAEPHSHALTVVQNRPPVETTVPDPEAWAARFLQAVVEVVSSDRPLSQLARWTSSSVFDEVLRRQQLVAAHRNRAATRSGRVQVATVHIFQASADIAEVAARVKSGQRSRAMAARLEYDRDRWQCTAIVFG